MTCDELAHYICRMLHEQKHPHCDACSFYGFVGRVGSNAANDALAGVYPRYSYVSQEPVATSRRGHTLGPSERKDLASVANRQVSLSLSREGNRLPVS
jgi:hypothetical protein